MSSEQDKIIAYEKGDLVYVYNFHPTNSFEDYRIGTFWKTDHFLVLDSDEDKFGGFQRLNGAHGIWFQVEDTPWNERPYSFRCYIPNRSVQVFCPYEHGVKMGNYPEMPTPTER